MRKLLFVLLVLMTCSFATTTETLEKVSLEATEAAVVHLVSEAPGRLLYRSERYRGRLVRDIVRSSMEYDVPAGVITMTAFKEGSFRTNAVGAIGEQTMMQVHGDWLDICRYKRMNLLLQRDQLRCGAYWLAKSYKKCGDWEKGITRYMSGKCVSKSKRTNKKVKERLELWEKLEAVAAAATDDYVQYVSLEDTFDEHNYTPMVYPERLTYEEIRLHIQKYRSHLNRCAPRSGEQVVLRMLIEGKTGTVVKVIRLNDARESLGSCVADVMRLMRFMKTETPYISVRVLITF